MPRKPRGAPADDHPVPGIWCAGMGVLTGCEPASYSVPGQLARYREQLLCSADVWPQESEDGAGICQSHRGSQEQDHHADAYHASDVAGERQTDVLSEAQLPQGRYVSWAL